MLTSNWKVSTGCSPQSFITFIQTTQNFVIILYIEHIETNLPIGKHTLRVLYEILKRLFQKFVSTFNLCVCFYLLHFVSLFNNLCCGALSRKHLRVTTKLSKLVQMSLHYILKYFCSLLTTNWKVNASLSLNSFLIVFPIAQQFVISSYTEDIETNLRIGKHT